jgi:hypothetical protein
MNMISIEQGGRYPLPIRTTEGAAANFLGDHHTLQIGMRNIQRSEANAIRKGTMKVGLIVDGPLILWVFEFKGDLIFDCPFDARLIPKEVLRLPDVSDGLQRMLIDIHLVDTATNTVRGIRAVTLPPGITRDFLAAVQDQLADARNIAPMVARYAAIDLLMLRNRALMQRCG